MAAGKTSVDEKWRYCSVCRRNHDEGRKHIFTKQHKNRLSVILSKFTKKVRSARRLLAKPSVLDGELEPGAKMWCYCCEKEIDKHVTDGLVTLEWGGLIEHMADPDHHKKSRHFWWVSGAESTQLQMFLLFPAEYRRYRDLAAEALKLVESERETKSKNAAEEAEVQQAHASSTIFEPVAHLSGNLSQGFWSQHTGPVTIPPQHQAGPSRMLHSGGSCPVTSHHLPSRPMKPPRPAPVKITVGAYGDNLTTIERKEPIDGFVGNVHSGATPPWLRDDDDSRDASANGGGSAGISSAVTFGPSLDEFIKHKERLRRAGKNPKRVGADFHLKVAAQKQDSDDWLPSFGRVWNYGPRVDSKSEFLKEKNRSKTAPTVNAGPSTRSSASVGSSSSPGERTSEPSLPQIKPYIRKRPRDSINETLSNISALRSSEAEGGEREVAAVDLDSVTVSFEVKPYVRKRKIKTKQEN